MRKALSITLFIAALGWTAEVLRQTFVSNDGGPALGAICMALPSVLLLVAAGATWPDRTPRPAPGWLLAIAAAILAGVIFWIKPLSEW